VGLHGTSVPPRRSSDTLEPARAAAGITACSTRVMLAAVPMSIGMSNIISIPSSATINANVIITMTSVTKERVSSYETPAFKDRFAKAEFPTGTIYMDLRLSKSELADGLARDVVRRMQQMRKEMDLKVDSYVHAYIVAPSNETAKLLRTKNKYLAHEVRAKVLRIVDRKLEVRAPYYTKTWQIDQQTFEFGLSEASHLKTKANRRKEPDLLRPTN
jgi:hypothetical protein